MKSKACTVMIEHTIIFFGEWCDHDCPGFDARENPEEPTEYACHFFPRASLEYKSSGCFVPDVKRCKECVEKTKECQP